jgi:hypothetical protein
MTLGSRSIRTDLAIAFCRLPVCDSSGMRKNSSAPDCHASLVCSSQARFCSKLLPS